MSEAQTKPRTAVIGAGLGGMSAAWDLVQAGHEVTIFDGAAIPGGLAAGFREPQWDWSVEKYYHHWFTSDKHMFGLIRELGLSDQLVIPNPKTVMYYDGRFYPLDSPLAALGFPGFSFFGMIRFGLVTVWLRFLARWQDLEKVTADAWMRKWYGPELYQTLFEPLLEGKFGPFKRVVNMAWMWARLKARTTRLVTFRGGFQALNDQFAAQLAARGVTIQLNTPVTEIATLPGGGMALTLPTGRADFDNVLVTTSPHQLARIAPQLPPDYLAGLTNMQSMGAVVMVLSLKHPLSPDGYYWYSLPKSAGYPFLALVEHTNFLKPANFGGEHILYCGDYLEQGHAYFDLSEAELLERFIPGIQKINPDFTSEWINKTWLWKTAYAQPIPLVNHSRNIPSIRTPLRGLYFASMSQVYPWDRGTNFAVEIGRRAASFIVNDSRDS